MLTWMHLTLRARYSPVSADWIAARGAGAAGLHRSEELRSGCRECREMQEDAGQTKGPGSRWTSFQFFLLRVPQGRYGEGADSRSQWSFSAVGPQGPSRSLVSSEASRTLYVISRRVVEEPLPLIVNAGGHRDSTKIFVPHLWVTTTRAWHRTYEAQLRAPSLSEQHPHTGRFP